MQLKPYIRFSLPALLLIFGGCSSLSASGSQGTTSMFSKISQSEDSETVKNAITARLIELDHAHDRNAARNALVRELVVESDRLCNNAFPDMSDEIDDWDVEAQKKDQLILNLEDAITHRELDAVNPQLTLQLPVSAANPNAALNHSVITTVKRIRDQARAELKQREDMDIHRYSAKQALLDVFAYHRLCSLPLGVSEVARKSSGQMTTDEKKTEIDALIQLRETLIKQGLSTRAIQQKIDEIILMD